MIRVIVIVMLMAMEMVIKVEQIFNILDQTRIILHISYVSTISLF